MTVKQAITAYIELRSNILSPSTVREYRYALKRYFGEIESIIIDKITCDIVQGWINRLSSSCSPKTVTNIWSLFHTTLNIYAPNLTLRVQLPPRRKKRIDIPSEHCVKRLIHESNSDDLRTAIILASCMGLRRSEICALRWADIHQDTHLIINKAAVINDERIIITKSPKTLSSDRILEIPDNVSKYLLQLKTSQKAFDTDMIVRMDPNKVTYYFSKLRRRIKIDCRFHDLRHYYASVLLALQIPDLYAMELMGHSTPTMLKRVYQHTLDYKMQESTTKINSYISEKMPFI